jgi:hypothetical protein
VFLRDKGLRREWDTHVEFVFPEDRSERERHEGELDEESHEDSDTAPVQDQLGAVHLMRVGVGEDRRAA